MGPTEGALGTTSSDFVNATLVQNASRMPSGGISETSVNAVLAFVEAAEPKNEIEAALAIQMACTHAVTMAVLSRAGGAYGCDRHGHNGIGRSSATEGVCRPGRDDASSAARWHAGHSRRKDRGFRYRTGCNRQSQPATARGLSLRKLARHFGLNIKGISGLRRFMPCRLLIFSNQVVSR